ncbi:hypothetical protein LSUE1_G007993 [Lachnellula suecica]|uniref:GRAM domain-containing protein n=1 Tax=Lachnellula suecica TaxID=602035 RepID=A0A8T9CGE9_9HELO|nr:hypothetical protein LSUE1_G007993 [Lachnellula suecica]
MQHNVPPPDTSSPDIVSNRHALQRVKDKAKAKTKRLLHIDSSDDEDEDEEKTAYEATVEELNDSPAFNTSKLLNTSRIGPAGLPDKAIALLQSTAHAIIDPKAAIKSRATRKTAGKLAKSRPYLSRQADLDFLEAHDDFVRAKEDMTNGNDDDETAAQKDGDIDHCAQHIQDLEDKRQSLRVAWVTARHVQRVRVVDAISPPPFPEESFFVEEDDCGFPEFNWGKWIGYVSLDSAQRETEADQGQKLLSGSHGFTAQYIDDFEELPFSPDTLRRHFERLIIVSAPIQTFISDIRCIYRWEDPYRTGTWMALYFFLWYISHIMTFAYGYLIYLVVMNYYYPTSVSDLRASIERTIDRGATAFKMGELMDKHGSNDWLGPLLDQIGPHIQVQVADLANIFESVYNFYHFSSSPATIASLCLFGALFIISAFGDAKLALKLFWFIVGLVFFICWPISSRYPRYRLLVSPLKWALWDVPTHAEWCFQYLQKRSAIAREAILSKPSDDAYVRTGSADLDSDTDSFHSAQSIQLDEERDILSFGCTHLNVPGRFIISTTALRFVSSIPLPYESFHEPFSSLLEMSKRRTHSSVLSPIAKVTTGMDKLELCFRILDTGSGKRAVVLENMGERDKAFNAVVGFSGLRWRHLQKT